jgi:hypothetical protein
MYGFVPPDCSTNPEQCDNRYDHVDSYYDIETNCFDGVDNDNNGDIDCSDVACCGIGSCSLDVCTADTTAPSFTSTNVDVFSDFLMMFWSTNEPTNASVLFYDTDSTCTNSPTVIDEFSESGDLFDNYLMWHNVALDNFEGVVTLSPSTTYYYKLISSNRADYYAQTSCLNVTTQVSNDEFNFMFDGGDGMDIEFDLGEGFESKDFSAGSQPFNNTKDAKVRFPDQGITFNGIDISKSKTINLSSMFKDGVDENGNAFAGIDSDKWLQMAQNLGLSSDENVTLTIEDNGDTIFKCDDNGNNCADVTSLVTVDSINSTHKNAIIPVYLGFSAYSSGSSADLTIWDQIELNASLFGAIGLIKFPGFNIPFYANFSNNSNGSLIGGANCNISFSDNWGSKFNMVEDSTNGVYNYTKIGGMIDPGTYNFNVTCGGVNGFDELTLLDSFIISNPQNVPEWDEWAIFMILIVAVSGFFVMKREE